MSLVKLTDLKGKKEAEVIVPIGTISIEELETQINEAKTGKAKVDKKYVGLGDGLDHLFEYNYDYVEFLSNIKYVIQNGKKRAQNSETYKSKHKVIIQ